MYRQKAPSVLPKSGLALFHLSAVCAAAWLLFAGGIRTVSGWLNLGADLASPLRRILLLGAAAMYFLRVLVTLFVFLKRRTGWAEVGTVAAWIGALHMCFAFFGGRQTAPVGLIEVVGVLLYLVHASIAAPNISGMSGDDSRSIRDGSIRRASSGTRCILTISAIWFSLLDGRF